MWPQPLVWLTGATYSRKNNKFALWSVSSSASKPEWIANKDRVCGGKHGNTLTNTLSIRPSFPRPRCSLPLPPRTLYYISCHLILKSHYCINKSFITADSRLNNRAARSLTGTTSSDPTPLVPLELLPFNFHVSRGGLLDRLAVFQRTAGYL